MPGFSKRITLAQEKAVEGKSPEKRVARLAD